MKTTTEETASASDPKAATPVTEGAPKGEVEAKPKTEEPKAKKPETTKRLFPGWTQTDSGRTMPPPETTGKEEESAKDTPPKSESEPFPQVPDEVIDPENLKGKKIKLKLDGKEEVIPVDEAIKGLQLEKHLTQKSQSLAEKERQIIEREKLLRQQLDALSQVKPPSPVDDPAKDSIVADDPLIKKMNERLEQVIKENEELKRYTTKARFEENTKVLSDQIKATYGFDDFMNYRDRVLSIWKSLPLETQPLVDNGDWWTSQYLALKNKDLLAEVEKVKSEKAAPAIPPRREGGPMTGIGESRGGAVGSESLQTFEAKYRAAFEKAKQTQDRDDWAEVFRLKEEAKSLR